MVYLNFCLKKSFPDRTILDVPMDSEDGEIYLCIVYNQNTRMGELQKEFVRFIRHLLSEKEEYPNDGLN